MRLVIEIVDLDKWRSAGRPPRAIPDDLMRALLYTREQGKMARLPRNSPDAPIDDAGLRALRNLLRSAVGQLDGGGRLRFQHDREEVRFRVEPTPDGSVHV